MKPIDKIESENAEFLAMLERFHELHESESDYDDSWLDRLEPEESEERAE